MSQPIDLQGVNKFVPNVGIARHDRELILKDGGELVVLPQYGSFLRSGKK